MKPKSSETISNLVSLIKRKDKGNDRKVKDLNIAALKSYKVFKISFW